MNGTEIVVGTDGSESGAAALRWAMREAERRGAPLHAVLAYDWPWPSGRFGGTEELRRMAETQAETVLADAVIEAASRTEGVTVHRETALGAPVPGLLSAADKAAMLVVGNRGHGGFASLLLGSVGQRVATHASCSVTVVRGRPDVTDGPVVVGVDGSPSSDDAVKLAFVLAAERQAKVIAIRAYTPPVPPWGVDVPPLVYDRQEVEAAEHDALAESIAPWREKYPQVDVEELVARGSAAQVLVDVSFAAQLVVVGSRGHGSLAGTLLGSVGLQLLHHADCPVVVARRPAHA